MNAHTRNSAQVGHESSVTDAQVMQQLATSTKKAVEAKRELDQASRAHASSRDASSVKKIMAATVTLQNQRKEVCAYAGIALARGLFDDSAAFLVSMPAKAV